jgi:hypothetical protein
MNTALDNIENCTERQKKLHQLWREKNRDRLKVIYRKASAVYYEKNKEKKNKADLERYYRKKAEKAQLEQNQQPPQII